MTAALPRAALLTTLVLLAASQAGAASPEEIFAKANAAFASGDPEGAVRGFREVLSSEGLSAALLYDLANAELRAGRPGEAILAYERALLLEPRNPDILTNLRQAERAANLPEPDRGTWWRAARLLTPGQWAWLATCTLWGACLIAALLALLPPSAEARAGSQRGARLLGGLLAAASLLAWSLYGTRMHELDAAIVVDSRPELRVAPYASADVSAEILPGQIVRVEREHEAFRLVRTNDGRAGWIAATAVEPILPRRGP